MAVAEFSNLYEEFNPSYRATAGHASCWAPTHLTGPPCPIDSSKFPFSFFLSVPCAKNWDFLLDWESKQTENMGGDSLQYLFLSGEGKCMVKEKEERGERKEKEEGKTLFGSKLCLQFSASSLFMKASKQDNKS